MLTEDGCRQRQQNLWSALPATIELALVGDPRHVQYFCGFRPNPISFSADQSAALLLSRDGNSVLFADNFTRRTAVSDVFVSEEVVQPWYDHQHSVGNRHQALSAILKTRVTPLDRAVLVAERDGLSAELLSVVQNAVTDVTVNGVKKSLGTVIRHLRRSKLPDEVLLLQRCMDAGAAGQAAAFDSVVPGATELDVYIAIQAAAQRSAGAACIVYGDFRATNAEVFKAGGLPTGYQLRDGDLMLLDFSVVIAGYRSDFTNTVAIGEPSGLQSTQADACIAALLASETKLAARESCAAVFETASAELVRRGYSGLSHHAGHGLGMEHPESPILVPQSTDTLQSGDVVTLEPGLYSEGSGGMRFEHNYLITDTGCERLSHHQLGLRRS
jgi:Xaa-Pro aminopeptidase